MSESTLFIPDISGFTRFVKQTEIKHGQHIIEELINLIIKEGSKTLKVAEIEGDAVFFFKHEEKLTPEHMRNEAKRIYIAFHQHLLDYKSRRICNCGACTTASELELKFIAHTGEIALVNFSGEKSKPYGEPVIAVHRLLKTKIGHSEYLLFSEGYAQDHKYDGKGSYEDGELGKIDFTYSFIEQWKEELKPIHVSTTHNDTNLHVETKREIPVAIDILHNFISDFQYRHLWSQGAEQVIFDESALNQQGTEHYCVVNGKNLFFETTKPEVKDSQMAYGEVLKDPAPFRYFQIDFILTPVNEQMTLLEVKMAAKIKWWQKLLVGILRKKLRTNASESLDAIVGAVSAESKLELSN